MKSKKRSSPKATTSRLKRNHQIQIMNILIKHRTVIRNLIYNKLGKFSNLLNLNLKGPNRSNPYHECTKYCFEKFGIKKFQPNPVMEKRRIRMLKIYPLPPNWIEVPDINS